MSLHGYEEDAQIMDEVLFKQLKTGFNEYVTHALPMERPNVIFTDLDEDGWMDEPSGLIGQQWVVIIDFHD
jgi:hypothetical protein